jgi:hypothetical protein
MASYQNKTRYIMRISADFISYWLFEVVMGKRRQQRQKPKWVTQDDVQRPIEAAVSRPAQTSAMSEESTRTRRTRNPPVVGLICAAISLIMLSSLILWVTRPQTGETHTPEDEKRDIALELSKKILIQRSVSQLRADIDLEDIKGAIGKLNGHDGPPKNRQPLLRLGEFKDLDDKQFAASLANLRQILNAMDTPQVAKGTREMLEKLRVRLVNTDRNAPQYWPTVLQLVQVVSSASENLAPPITQRPLVTVANSDIELADEQFVDGVLFFDESDISMTNCTLHRCRLIIDPNKTLRLHNVTLIDCVLNFINSDKGPISPSVKHAVEQFLTTGLARATVST